MIELVIFEDLINKSIIYWTPFDSVQMGFQNVGISLSSTEQYNSKICFTNINNKIKLRFVGINFLCFILCFLSKESILKFHLSRFGV